MKTLPLTTVILALIALTASCTDSSHSLSTSGKLVSISFTYGTIGCPERHFGLVQSGNAYQPYVQIPSHLLSKAENLLGKEVVLTAVEQANINPCKADRVLTEIRGAQ